jgi:hypothetical protein
MARAVKQMQAFYGHTVHEALSKSSSPWHIQIMVFTLSCLQWLVRKRGCLKGYPRTVRFSVLRHVWPNSQRLLSVSRPQHPELFQAHALRFYLSFLCPCILCPCISLGSTCSSRTSVIRACPHAQCRPQAPRRITLTKTPSTKPAQDRSQPD